MAGKNVDILFEMAVNSTVLLRVRQLNIAFGLWNALESSHYDEGHKLKRHQSLLLIKTCVPVGQL